MNTETEEEQLRLKLGEREHALVGDLGAPAEIQVHEFSSRAVAQLLQHHISHTDALLYLAQQVLRSRCFTLRSD